MTELWVATTNRDKMREIRELLKELPLQIFSSGDVPQYVAPQESGLTFKENARIKAKFLKAIKPDAWVIADDSGLEVDCLDGLPGVHSARYAGQNARDIENTLKVLKQISLKSDGSNRKARFRCAICLMGPSPTEEFFEGVLEGEIARDMRGKAGFGYDPIFIPEGETKTIAELGLAVKNRLSHRAKALKQFKAFIANSLTPKG